ncbi:MAG: hypothetical protein ACI30D_07650 [Muribaculaceae bacterium]
MKKYLLLSFLALLGFAAKAEQFRLIVWKSGCSAMYNLSEGDIVDGNKWIYFSGTNKGTDAEQVYELQFSRVVTVNEGDRFCLNHGEWGSVTWVHNPEYYPDKNNEWFTEGGDGKDMYLRAGSYSGMTVKYRPSENKYALELITGEPEEVIVPTGTGRYNLQIWDYNTSQDDKECTWNTSGGLYKVWRSINGEKRYPLAGEYLRKEKMYESSDYETEMINFRKLEAGEMSEYKARKMADPTDYEVIKAAFSGKDIPDETGATAEYYVVDFTKGGTLPGIYIEVPSVEDIFNDGKLGDVNKFYRGGIRFSFIDLFDDFKSDDSNWANNFRFVKWGHAFRLNEMPRPLNAFPVYNGYTSDADGGHPKIVGFSDDFGPTQWNGFDYKNSNTEEDFFGLQNGNDYIAKKLSDTNSTHDKIGDTRLLAEYPFYLHKIYLEVVQDKSARKKDGTLDERYKHFYLSFEGDYDLSAGVKCDTKWIYADASEGNHVNGKPNIFHASVLTTNEPAFQRFYNLDAENDATVQKLIGCTSQDYKAHTGKGNTLYLLDYTDGYSAESHYAVKNAANETLKYAESAEGEVFERDFKYNAANAKYTTETGEAETQEIGLNRFINPTVEEILFDPEDAAYVPAYVDIQNKFEFPNAGFGVYNAHYQHPVNYQQNLPASGFEVAGEPVWKDLVDGKYSFMSSLDWSAFESVDPANPSGKLPVLTYDIEYNGEHGLDSTPEEFVYEPAYDRDFWISSDEKTVSKHQIHTTKGADITWPYFVHYNVNTQYNFAYVQGGIYPADMIGDDQFSTIGSEKVVNAAPRAAGEQVITAGEVSYVIRPMTVTGHAAVRFTGEITAVESVDADNSAEAPAEYFNLQGMRVANPVAGQIYIVRQGSKVDKRVYTL